MLKSPFFLVSRRLDFDFLLPLVGSSKSKHNSHMKTARQKTFSFSQSPVHLPPLGSPIYGKRAVIQGVSILENRFRNGFKMTISPRELQRANQISNFEHMSVATPRCVPKEGMVTTFARTLKCNTYKRGPTTPFNIVIAQPYYWTSLPRESCAAKPFRIFSSTLAPRNKFLYSEAVCGQTLTKRVRIDRLCCFDKWNSENVWWHSKKCCVGETEYEERPLRSEVRKNVGLFCIEARSWPVMFDVAPLSQQIMHVSAEIVHAKTLSCSRSGCSTPEER